MEAPCPHCGYRRTTFTLAHPPSFAVQKAATIDKILTQSPGGIVTEELPHPVHLKAGEVTTIGEIRRRGGLD